VSTLILFQVRIGYPYLITSWKIAAVLPALSRVLPTVGAYSGPGRGGAGPPGCRLTLPWRCGRGGRGGGGVGLLRRLRLGQREDPEAAVAATNGIWSGSLDRRCCRRRLELGGGTANAEIDRLNLDAEKWERLQLSGGQRTHNHFTV